MAEQEDSSSSGTTIPKRIVLCSDGTGNKGGVGRDTNVWRLYNMVDLSSDSTPRQIAFYDDGIGTQDMKFVKALGGAFGIGMSRNVRQLYEMLALNYTPGDEIYVFGFSRGAYTARVLTALICMCGIVKLEGYTTSPGQKKDSQRSHASFSRTVRRSSFNPLA